MFQFLAALPSIVKLSAEPRLCNERLRIRGFREAFEAGDFDSELRGDEYVGLKLLDRAEEVAPACEYVSQKLAQVQSDWPRSRRFLLELGAGAYAKELRAHVDNVLDHERRLRAQAASFLNHLRGELLPEERGAEGVQQLVQDCMLGIK